MIWIAILQIVKVWENNEKCEVDDLKFFETCKNEYELEDTQKEFLVRDAVTFNRLWQKEKFLADC